MTKAYTKYIGKNTDDSHQTSPHWLITFTRFNTRDSFNYGELGPEKLEPVRNPLVVENDCISVSVSTSKTNTTPNATITLASGDLNYGTAVSPGDFVIVNMVNSSQKARQLRDRAVQELSINRVGDGFKGIFKINSVNKIINVDPNSGQKILRYQVTAYGFTEFNNLIYYNPTLGNSVDKDVLLYQINEDLLKVLNSKLNIQQALELLPKIIIGNGTVNLNSEILDFKKVPYEIPMSVFKLLGLKEGDQKGGNSAADLYRLMVGIWNNTTSGSNISEGFNPSYEDIGSVQRVGANTSAQYSLSGRIPIQTTPLQNVKLSDLLKRFSNELINEIYYCYRVDKGTQKILPKVIIRQKPFNTEHGVRKNFKKVKEEPIYKKIEGTKFLSLPRWKISSDLIYNINVSKNESLRFNFVHIIGTTGNPAIDGANIAFQNAQKGTVIADETDIKRHGLRPYTAVSNFDWPIDGKDTVSYAPKWAELCWDWVYGGHLKANGKITTVGIQEDICIGDNLELQDTVYHIESINHICSISANGIKSFRTNITLTHGVDKRTSKRGPVYPEMDHTDTFTDRKHDYDEGYGILPGFSDTQDIIGREKGEETKETKQKSYTKPGLKDKINNNDEN